MSEAGTEGLVERLASESDPQVIAELIVAALAERDARLEANARALAEARAEIERKTRDIEAKARILTRMAQNVTAAERQRDEALRQNGVWDFPRDIQNLTVKLETTERERDEAREALKPLAEAARAHEAEQGTIKPRTFVSVKFSALAGARSVLENRAQGLADAHSENPSPSSRGPGE